MSLLELVLRIQAVYYVVTGLWPVFSLWSFEVVTGPKTDDWLVYMVALLAVAIGVTLWVGARPSRCSGAIVFLGGATAVSFATIDIVFALGGRIPLVYLLDAVGELVLLGGLLAGGARRRGGA